VRKATFTTLALLALPLAACGGGGAKTQSRADVVPKANAICRQAGAQAKSYAADRPGPVGSVQVRAALQKDVDIASAAARQLRALDPAEEQKADFDRFVAGVEGIAAGDRRFIRGIHDNDHAGIAAGSAAAVAAAARAKKGADAYGLDDCPYEPVSVRFSRQAKAAALRVAAAQDPIGRWTGRVTQFGPGSKRYHYGAIMTVRNVNTVGALAGAISYPSFPCAGELRLTGRRANRFAFLEHITAHATSCPSGGRITSTVSSGRMAWRWVRKDIVVLGTLTRR
jgi:hypothetical protein